MVLRAAVFCHNGLGDGINCLVLSQHLHLNGFSVDTYQNTIGSLQAWFPHLPIYTYPDVDRLEEILKSYDYYFVVWNDSSEFVLRLIAEGKKRFPEQTKVIYLYPSPNIVHERYYTDCLTNPRAPVAENMRILSREVMHLPKFTYDSPLTPPSHLKKHRYPKRIVIHPTSGRASKNWGEEKFVKLALHLRNAGYETIFIPGSQDLAKWSKLGPAIDFPNLDLLAQYLYESGVLIGNDSGPGHLASSVGIPTVTICRRKAVADLWAPSFSKCVPIAPSSLIPNIRGLRLRDVHWKKFITVGRVLRGLKEVYTPR